MGESTPRPLPRAGQREFVTICCVVIAFIALAIVVAGTVAFEATALVWLVALATIPFSRFWSLFGVELRPALRHYTLGAIWLGTFDLSFEGVDSFDLIAFVFPFLLFLAINAVAASISLARMWREPFAWLTAGVCLSGLFGSSLVLEAKQAVFGRRFPEEPFAMEDELRARFAAWRDEFLALEAVLADGTASPTAKKKIRRLARSIGLEWIDLTRHVDRDRSGWHFQVWREGIPPAGSSMAFVFDRSFRGITDPSVDEGCKRARAADPRKDDFAIYVDLGGGWYLRYEHW